MNAIERFFLPPAKTAIAHEVDKLFWFVHITGFLLAAGILIAIVYFCIKYRRKSEDEVTPVRKGDARLEVTWSVIPLLFVLVIFGWGMRLYLKEQSPPDDAYKIHVIAQQWLWQFKYDNGVISQKKLHVPAGRPIKLIMKSNDVIHDLFIPAFRIKQDILPNRNTMEWFKSPTPDTSQIFCAEYCGAGHSNMLGKVIVQTPEKFQEWLSNQKSSGGSKPSGLSEAEWGKKIHQQHACNTCHSVDGSAGTGPTWKGIYGSTVQFKGGGQTKVDSAYIVQSIKKPDAKIVKGFQPGLMPQNYADQLNGKQIQALIAYIKTLK